jgi:recombinational DNA repair protein (RecF pathway)
VLHSFKYGESRMIVDMFTEEVGRQSFIISIPKTSKGRIKKQYFQPMTLLEVECDVRQNVQLQKLKDAHLLTAYTSIPFRQRNLLCHSSSLSFCITPYILSSRTNFFLLMSAIPCCGSIWQRLVMPTSTLPF